MLMFAIATVRLLETLVNGMLSAQRAVTEWFEEVSCGELFGTMHDHIQI
jgi:hypothetical protein